MIIKRLTTKRFGRKSKRSSVAPHVPPVPSIDTTPRRPIVQAPSVLATWESELRAIAAEAAAWTVETGGDLFGRWNAAPMVFLATRAGPNAQRNNAHFRLDVDYLRQLSEPLAADWNLRYFGDWHSHHRLGLYEPSSGDRRRIRQLGARNSFSGMVEIIVTTEGSRSEPVVRVHPWLYDLSREAEPKPLRVSVLPGCSPIRQALIAAKALPEQSLHSWEDVPLDRVRLAQETALPNLEKAIDVDVTTRDKMLAQFTDALREASGEPIEHHVTAFGHVVVVPLQEPFHLAFAIDGKWPMSVLEIHRLDRRVGSTAPIEIDEGLTALDVARVIDVFRAAKNEQRA